jgi:glycosyltransferase involved in cell wall biosynthesis
VFVREAIDLSSEPNKLLTVSVVIPVFNSQLWIRETLISVCEQELIPDEIVIVNDGSTDKSLEEIHAVCRDYPAVNLVIHTIKNSGVSAARNLGISLCTSELIALLDSDDVWLPQKLKLQQSFLSSNVECVAVLSDFFISIVKEDAGLKDVRLISKKHVKNVGKSWLTLRGNGALLSSTILFRKDAVVGKVFFNDRLSTAADLDFFLRLSEVGEVGHIFKPLTRYRQHINQMHLSPDLLKRDFPILLDALDRANIKVDTRLILANMFVMSGILHCVHKDFAAGFQDLWKGARLNPLSFFTIPSSILLKRVKSHLSFVLLGPR